MKKLLVGIVFAFVVLLSSNSYVLAAKKVVYSPQTGLLLNYTQTNLKVSFNNVKKAKLISYTLMYESNGIPQGVGGTLSPKGKNSVVKNITIGTCSSGTCVSHKKLKKMKIEVVFEFPGKTITKVYNIKTK